VGRIERWLPEQGVTLFASSIIAAEWVDDERRLDMDRIGLNLGFQAALNGRRAFPPGRDGHFPMPPGPPKALEFSTDPAPRLARLPVPV